MMGTHSGLRSWDGMAIDISPSGGIGQGYANGNDFLSSADVANDFYDPNYNTG